MFAPKSDEELPPQPAPLSTPYTVEQLKEFNGQVEGKPIYVCIKGDIFDVSSNSTSYGKGAGYNIFAGKDASYGLATSSLKADKIEGDISTLTEKQVGVLDHWHSFFAKRYPIIGKLVKQ